MIELFDKYLEGELSAADTLKFEQKLIDNPSFQMEFEQYQQQVLGIEAHHLRSIIKTHRSAAKSGPGTSKHKMNWIIITVGAILGITALLLVIFSKENKQSTPLPVYADYFKPDPGLPTTMGSADDIVFMDAMVDYKKGAYIKSVEKWTKLFERDQDNEMLAYFLGNAHQAQNNASQAKTYYEVLLEHQDSPYYGAALFRLAIIEAEIGNEDQARAYLYLSDHPGAAQLIQLLDK
jgi:tetratricopeptide (TPR) repeat protein